MERGVRRVMILAGTDVKHAIGITSRQLALHFQHCQARQRQRMKASAQTRCELAQELECIWY